MWHLPDVRPSAHKHQLSVLCEHQLVTITCVTGSTTTPVIGQNCAVGVVNAEMQKMSWPETLFLSRKQPPECYFLITKGSGVPAITLAFAEQSMIFAHFLFFITFSEAIALVGRRRNNAWS